MNFDIISLKVESCHRSTLYHIPDAIFCQVKEKVMIGDDEVFVRLKCFISKLNSSCTAFFQ